MFSTSNLPLSLHHSEDTNGLPFGLSLSSDIFQRSVNQALEGLSGVLDITDDILIFGDPEQKADEDHDNKLRALLQRCRDRRIALN